MPDVALRLLDEMKAEGIPPNGITYNAAVHASAGGGARLVIDVGSPQAVDDDAAVPPSSAAGGLSSSVPTPALRPASAAQGRRSDEDGSMVGPGYVPTDKCGSAGSERKRTVENDVALEGMRGLRRWERVMPLVDEMQAAG